jgi:hypothetical protein
MNTRYNFIISKSNPVWALKDPLAYYYSFSKDVVYYSQLSFSTYNFTVFAANRFLDAAYIQIPPFENKKATSYMSATKIRQDV